MRLLGYISSVSNISVGTQLVLLHLRLYRNDMCWFYKGASVVKSFIVGVFVFEVDPFVRVILRLTQPGRVDGVLGRQDEEGWDRVDLRHWVPSGEESWKNKRFPYIIK